MLIYTVDVTCATLALLTGASDLARMADVLALVAERLPTRVAGKRFRQLIDPGKKAHTHDYFLLMGARGGRGAGRGLMVSTPALQLVVQQALSQSTHL